MDGLPNYFLRPLPPQRALTSYPWTNDPHLSGPSGLLVLTGPTLRVVRDTGVSIWVFVSVSVPRIPCHGDTPYVNLTIAGGPDLDSP